MLCCLPSCLPACHSASLFLDDAPWLVLISQMLLCLRLFQEDEAFLYYKIQQYTKLLPTMIVTIYYLRSYWVIRVGDVGVFGYSVKKVSFSLE